ncbi:MAG: hypothetical protein WD048_11950 [Chitinophagales bacterium]
MKQLFVIFTSYLFIEFIIRFSLSILYPAEFFQPWKIIYQYYPQALKISEEYATSDRQQNKILILSSSALTDEWGGFEKVLEEKLNENAKDWQVFNGSGVGFTSLDNLNTLQLLNDLKFDYLIYYNSINDARLNNCPPDVFESDYTHIRWNNEVASIMRHKEINITVIPFVLDFLAQKLRQKIFDQDFIPDNYKDRPDWQKYGSDFKSLKSFDKNLSKIIKLNPYPAKNIIIDYNYYVPDNYSYEDFINKRLDYRYHDKSREIEVWGYPDNVSNFIDSCNHRALKIAEETANTQFYSVKNRLSSSAFFADICHYSEKGIDSLAFFASIKIIHDK